MQLIRMGFDGLDISYPLTISEELAEKMQAGRQVAELGNGERGQFVHNGVRMEVAASGARGGYAYRCDSGFGGPFGEVWFFKKPTEKKDDWGVRVSCRALRLALDGLAKTRARIEATLAKLGLDYVPGTESIGRVDVACDVLAPNLVLDRAQFVAPASSRVQEIADSLVQVIGRPGRVESVTIGKNPQRQVVVYDKRAEVIATGKPYWWPIWDEALAAQGLPSLDRTRREASAVWRVEIRAFKRHLKDTWSVTTWGHLREQLRSILHHALCDVRFVTPTDDTNRARWPDHPLWTLAYEAFTVDMEDLHSMMDPAVIEGLVFDEGDHMLQQQIAGCLMSRAALHGLARRRLYGFANACVADIVKSWRESPERTEERLSRARARYGMEAAPGPLECWTTGINEPRKL